MYSPKLQKHIINVQNCTMHDICNCIVVILPVQNGILIYSLYHNQENISTIFLIFLDLVRNLYFIHDWTLDEGRNILYTFNSSKEVMT